MRQERVNIENFQYEKNAKNAHFALRMCFKQSIDASMSYIFEKLNFKKISA
jgi:hypothetical protein